jgi:hypothetical protein
MGRLGIGRQHPARATVEAVAAPQHNIEIMVAKYRRVWRREVLMALALFRFWVIDPACELDSGQPIFRPNEGEHWRPTPKTGSPLHRFVNERTLLAAAKQAQIGPPTPAMSIPDERRRP